MAHRRNEILSTLFSTDAPMEDWLARVDTVRSASVLQVVARASDYRAVVLDGSCRAGQIAAALISARRRPPLVVIADSTWKSNTNPVDMAISKLGVRAIDGTHATFCVISSYELESFRRTWGPLKGQVRFVPWPCTLPETELSRPASDNGRVFAGGNSLRDYDLLLEAAASISAPVDLATNALTERQRAGVPDNVRARRVASQVYDELMLNSAVVVVPLEPRRDRSAGQTTYVQAMARGKPVIVTDTPGVRDYIQDGHTGVIVPPRDPDALAAAIRALLDDPDERKRMGESARAYVLEHLTLPKYARRLLAVVDEALER